MRDPLGSVPYGVLLEGLLIVIEIGGIKTRLWLDKVKEWIVCGRIYLWIIPN